MASKYLQVTKSAGLVLAGTVISLWIIELIPFDKLPVSHYWKVIIVRSVTSLLSVAAMFIWFPSSLRRLKFKCDIRGLLVGMGVLALLIGPSLVSAQYSNFRLAQILQGFVFALFIGIDEELFSRGFIYSALEKYGLAIAATLSSIHFGLLHISNIFWGGQSVSYTMAQVLNAAAFGFLCVGLMIFTRTIWFSVLLHGLYDFPIQFQSSTQYTKIVTGHADWTGTIVNALIYILIGWVLIHSSKSQKNPKFLAWANKLSLVEVNEPNPEQDQ